MIFIPASFLGKNDNKWELIANVLSGRTLATKKISFFEIGSTSSKSSKILSAEVVCVSISSFFEIQDNRILFWDFLIKDFLFLN